MNGMKFDQGKPRVDLIDPRFLLELGEVLSLYDENNEPAVEPKRYKAAALRCMYQYCAGEKVDKESSKSHLVHAACNLMFLYGNDSKFLLELGEVLGFGAEKYGENNWQGVEPKRYKAAALRHMYQYCSGEKVDKESGKSHLVHAACNLMFLYWSDKNEVRSESDSSLGDA